MINSIIPILVAFLPIWKIYLVPLFALSFIVTVPCIARGIVSYYKGGF